MATFSAWIDTFLTEKGIDGDEILTVEGPSGENAIPVACLVDAMKTAPARERAQLKTMFVKLDFMNAPIRPYLVHLASVIAI